MREEVLLRRLHAYHDGELGWWARSRLEARLRRSPALRRELAMLSAIGRAARDSESGVGAPMFWEDIAGELRTIDAAAEESGARDRGSLASALMGRLPLGAAALAAAAVVGFLILRIPPAPPVPEAAVSGVVRYLDTGEESVMLVEDWDDVTIIWLMDSPSGEV